MSALAISDAAPSLPALVRSAAQKLAAAESSAEVLDARDTARVAYDAAKIAGRLAKAKTAHDEIIVTVYRAQADALAIESAAKARLADEYDAAQERGEVRANGERSFSSAEKVSHSDLGLTGKDIHEARQVRDAELADPGIVRRTLDGLVESGQEPTRAAVKRQFSPRPEPVVSNDALWLWGRLKDFEREGTLGIDPRALLSRMTEPMRADMRRLAPRVREFLEELEVACEPA